MGIRGIRSISNDNLKKNLLGVNITNKILLFTLLAAVITFGIFQLDDNLAFSQTTTKTKVLNPIANGPTSDWSTTGTVAGGPADKVGALSDRLKTTHITSSVNNQGQNM